MDGDCLDLRSRRRRPRARALFVAGRGFGVRVCGSRFARGIISLVGTRRCNASETSFLLRFVVVEASRGRDAPSRRRGARGVGAPVFSSLFRCPCEPLPVSLAFKSQRAFPPAAGRA